MLKDKTVLLLLYFVMIHRAFTDYVINLFLYMEIYSIPFHKHFPSIILLKSENQKGIICVKDEGPSTGNKTSLEKPARILIKS